MWAPYCYPPQMPPQQSGVVFVPVPQQPGEVPKTQTQLEIQLLKDRLKELKKQGKRKAKAEADKKKEEEWKPIKISISTFSLGVLLLAVPVVMSVNWAFKMAAKVMGMN